MVQINEIRLEDLLDYLCFHEDPDWKPGTLEEAFEHAHEAFCHAVSRYLEHHPEVEEFDGTDTAFYDAYRDDLEEDYVFYITGERYQKEFDHVKEVTGEQDLEFFYRDYLAHPEIPLEQLWEHYLEEGLM